MRWLLGVVLIVGAAALAGCSSSDSGGEGDGGNDVVAAMADRVDGVATPFLVPTGTVTVTVGDPVTGFSDAEARDGDGRVAPEGQKNLSKTCECKGGGIF